MLEALTVKGHLKVSVEHGRLLYALWEGLSPIIHQSAWKNSPKFAVALCAPIAPVLWPRTGPRRNFFSISSTVATTVTRVRYKPLRLATV
jgi:hypothetical protein